MISNSNPLQSPRDSDYKFIKGRAGATDALTGGHYWSAMQWNENHPGNIMSCPLHVFSSIQINVI